ncbi:MAG: SIR2 family protein [Tissierellales bacterium]|nr:SIR2 family protein [Tissierellales bacterium]
MKSCDCVVCKHHHEFESLPDLLNDFESGKVTIFAGSGISTESRNVLRHTFYDEVADELHLEDCTLSFPELMEEYCSQPNGRIKLLTKIRNRFKYINSFPELNRVATNFHQELATLFTVRTIVTTNWDMYFEEICLATPFVSDQDLAFWENENRRVLKIHGSINNYGSIVATTNDYLKCQDRLHTGLIGGILKTLFATQTTIFIGYSLNDSDFLNIWDFVSKQMNGLQRQAYVITPFEVERKKIEDLGLIPIIADGSFFISQAKKHFISKGAMLPDSIYFEAVELLSIVEEQHDLIYENFNCSDHPQIIIAASYQDGMIHALERTINLRGSGEYSHPCNIRGALEPYQRWQKEKLKAKKYEDVAYIEGYLNGLIFLLLNEDEKSEIIHPPIFFAFGVDELYTLNDYKKVINDLPRLHKASYSRAKKMVDKLSSSNGMVFHHPAWL